MLSFKRSVTRLSFDILENSSLGTSILWNTFYWYLILYGLSKVPGKQWMDFLTCDILLLIFFFSVYDGLVLEAFVLTCLTLVQPYRSQTIFSDFCRLSDFFSDFCGRFDLLLTWLCSLVALNGNAIWIPGWSLTWV